jgi:hypothetical protein
VTGRGTPSLLGVGVGVSSGDEVLSGSSLENSMSSFSSTVRIFGGKWSGPLRLALGGGRTPIGLGRAAAVMDLILDTSFIYPEDEGVLCGGFLYCRLVSFGSCRVRALVIFGRVRFDIDSSLLLDCQFILVLCVMCFLL